jgi:hypothetical protein
MYEMTHMHITAWLIAVILFFVAIAYKKNAKAFKVLHMITRVFYILIILSGGILISDFGAYAVKIIVGLIVIVLMEMILVRTKKEKSTTGLWVAFVIAFIAVVYLGLSLPQGFSPFA